MLSRKWLRRAVASAAVSVVIFVVFVVVKREVVRGQGNRELAVAQAETDAADPDWRWAQLNAGRKQPLPDQNSAPLIAKIKKLSTPDWGKWRVGNSPHPDQSANVRYPAETIAAARADLAASAEAVRLARTLMHLPDGHREIVLAPNPLATNIQDTQDTRLAADLLKWDVVVAVEDEDCGTAADDLLAALNVSRSIGDEPFMISQLVRVSTRAVAVRSLECALAQTRKPEALKALRLEQLQSALAADADAPLLLYGIRGDRAVFDILHERVNDGTLDMVEAPLGRPAAAKPGFDLGRWQYRSRLPAERAFTLRWMNAAADAARKPIHEQRAAIELIPPLPNDKYPLSRALLSAVNSFAVMYWRDVAGVRCAVVGIACERFRLKHGRWPATLAELCPEFIVEVPLDPFDGLPLQYRKLDDGIAVHSSGPTPVPYATEIDVALAKRATARPGFPQDILIGFRLWNPDQRRLPSPPEVAPPPREVEKP